ncbi:MAG: hypothetical protein ABI401_05805 [Candidatus Dormibacter sp.]
MNADSANAARCQDRAGTYEAWYVTIAEPKQRRGFWIRYTTFNPARGVQAEAHSALWAFSFDHEDPSANWGARVQFPLGALRVSSRPFLLRLNDALMVRNGCSGELHSERGIARWNLRWDSREAPFPFLRPRWQMLSSVANIAAHPALKVSGTIEINGKVHHLEHAPGGQQHTWGSSHALEWNWGFASGDDFWLDGATSRVKSRFGRTLVGTAVGAHAREQRFLFNGPVQVLRARGEMDIDAWTAKARMGDRVLHIGLDPRRADLIGVTYDDPAGGSRYCYHTEVADVEMRLTRGDELLARVHRPAAGAFEYASETPVTGVPLLI